MGAHKGEQGGHLHLSTLSIISYSNYSSSTKSIQTKVYKSIQKSSTTKWLSQNFDWMCLGK